MHGPSGWGAARRAIRARWKRYREKLAADRKALAAALRTKPRLGIGTVAVKKPASPRQYID
jgi:hypothetical protein